MPGRRGPHAAGSLLAVAVLVLAAVGAPAPVVATDAAVSGTDASIAAAPNVTRTVTYDRTPNRTGSVVVTVDYHVGPGVQALVQGVPDDATPLSVSGFRPREAGSDFAWNGTDTRPSLTLRLPVNETDSGRVTATDTGAWALFGGPYLVAAVAAGGRVFHSHTDSFPTTYRANRSGVADRSLVYLGNHTAATADGLRVVVPEAATPRYPPARIASSVAHFGARLRVGDDDPVTAIVAPAGPGWRDAGHAYGDAAFWVADDAPRHTWFHEFVHTRQPFDLGPGMAWFREASASYYASLGRLRRGSLAWDEFYDGPAVSLSVTLSAPSTWDGTYADYRYGSRVLAALDAHIRRTSGGDATLQTVFAWTNAHDGTVSYLDFRAFVAEAGSPRLGRWFDRYVASPRLPAVPRDACLFRPPDDGDADGDGLRDDWECRGARPTNPYAADTDGDGVPDGADPAPAVAERPAVTWLRGNADVPADVAGRSVLDASDVETRLLVALTGAVGEGVGATLRAG